LTSRSAAGSFRSCLAARHVLAIMDPTQSACRPGRARGRSSTAGSRTAAGWCRGCPSPCGPTSRGPQSAHAPTSCWSPVDGRVHRCDGGHPRTGCERSCCSIRWFPCWANAGRWRDALRSQAACHDAAVAGGNPTQFDLDTAPSGCRPTIRRRPARRPPGRRDPVNAAPRRQPVSSVISTTSAG
jgi:hypothetical protein